MKKGKEEEKENLIEIKKGMEKVKENLIEMRTENKEKGRKMIKRKRPPQTQRKRKGMRGTQRR